MVKGKCKICGKMMKEYGKVCSPCRIEMVKLEGKKKKKMRIYRKGDALLSPGYVVTGLGRMDGDRHYEGKDKEEELC